MPDGNLEQAVEVYFTDLRLVRVSGGRLRPKVFCVQDLINQGVGIPTSGCTLPSRCRRAR